MQPQRRPRLGIDIGRVIIDGPAHPDGGDTAFFQGDEATMLATPEMAGAVEAIARLVDRFQSQVWLVSKCGPRVQARAEQWLQAHRFFERSGIPGDQVRFCRRRADKRQVCVELGSTHFVDDRLGVHAALRGAVEHQFVFGPQPGPVPAYVIHVADWAQAEAAILATLG